MNRTLTHVVNSVVFASAYRFSVLFSYSATDPTYTLAPTVGWTAIEMSAGIVSACLPTMRPVLQWAGRGVGLKGGIFGNSIGNSAAFSKNLDASANRLRSTPDPSNADFYRLPDDNASGRTAEQLALDAKLRPEHGFAYAVTSKPGKLKGEGDSLSSGDEIPLQGIRVQTDFKHSG
jgi:hypothetical protein